MVFYSEHGTLIWIVIESMQPHTKLVHLGLSRENTDRSPRWNQTKIEPIRKTITYIVANNFQVYKIPPSISLLGYVDMGYDEKNSIICNCYHCNLNTKETRTQILILCHGLGLARE